MSWNSLPLSAAGSLSVAVVALFFVAFQSIFFARQRKLTSNAWAALFSLSSAGYAFFVFLQFIGPASSLQRLFDRAQFSFLVVMAYSLCGYTFSYLNIPGRLYHLIAAPLSSFVLGVLWLSDLIVRPTLISRSFRWVSRPYVESSLGPLGAPFMALVVAAALLSLSLWITRKTRHTSDRRIFATGLCVFIALGVHDALVSNGVMASVQFFLEYGFLAFASSILFITVREYIWFESTAATLRRINEELGELAVTDQLTQLANRRGFDTRFDQEWRSLARQKRQKSHAGAISVLLCDVDFFKGYNDTYGHQEGDRCLTAVAAVLARATRRPMDLVSRFGGDEFAMLLPDTPLDGARAVAAAVLASLEALRIPHDASGVHAFVTVSIGIASARAEEDITSEQLITRADRALYLAKSLGRNRAEIYDEKLDPAR